MEKAYANRQHFHLHATTLYGLTLRESEYTLAAYFHIP